MPYRKYGQSFRNLRLQHHLSQKYFEKIGISAAMLSVFENGKSMISFDKLDDMLQEMNVTLFDYSIMVNDGEAGSFLKVFSDIENLSYKYDRKKLNAIYEDYNQYSGNEKLIALSAKSHYAPLTPEEIKIVENYLEEVKYWGIFELLVLENTMTSINSALLKKIAENFWDFKKYYASIVEYKTLIMRIITKATLRFIADKEKVLAELMLERIKSLQSPADATSGVYLKFLQGDYIYIFDNKVKGRAEMRAAVQILKQLGMKELFVVFRNYYYQITHANHA